jgi:LCP family protein required for cell wall assembly
MSQHPEGVGTDMLPPRTTVYRAGRGASRAPVPTSAGPARRRWPVVLLALLLVPVLLLAGLFVWADRQVQHVAALPAGPRPAQNPGTDYLIVGSDSRAGLSREEKRSFSTGTAAGRRADTIMLLHDGAAGATLVSLPRDSYVPIPGRERNKLNAAYAFGGPRLLAGTVEQVTGVRLDHVVEVDLRGFVGIVDAVDGVRLCLDDPLQDDAAGIDLPAGCQQLSGPQALGYVRARKSDPRGDLGRVERQQQFLAGLSDRLASPATLANPVNAVRVTDATLEALRVDRDTGIIDLARLGLAMRAASGSEGTRTTVPVADPDFAVANVGSTVLWDRERALTLFRALQADEPVSAAAGGP